ncbi:2-oxoacid:acceptor oxidoreductase subunit alpha [Candidatus Bathyarchaeota archaeon]|nr:MAG: 2-oxoacid:acceptor oxidoreductase subunit alpha [Candidatus Bathyarchaeota archaeon]RLI31407.1 MAG: 2-oxoacid:acceptor oxidoreductase subunit alpha [Candidatus Bathyarchaeota archaeon]
MLPPGKHLVLGNIACAEGAIRAGCRFFAGYPITPANEITQHMAEELPRVGGYFLQMEDEIASMAAVIGASWAGAKAMTATSGPGFSLMQENIGYAYMTETPCVVVDVQRSGPSTGQATMPSQQDFYQARYGAHGDYEAVVLSPWSVQEMFDLTVRAFNLAERFRTPVILLADGMIGHMMEKLVIPEKVETVERRRPAGASCTPFGTEDPSLVPEMPRFGEGYRLLVTGSSHDPTGRRDYSPRVMEAKLRRMREKILRAEGEVRDIVEAGMGDARIAVLSYGASARPSYGAVMKARKEGIRAGLMRLRTLWPFPEEYLSKVAGEVEAFLVVEMNLGKAVREVERAVHGRVEVTPLTRVGGVVPTVEEVYQAIRRVDECL